MGRQQLQMRNRRSLVWCLVGFALVQLALALGLETCWPGIRDPDFDDLLRVVKARAPNLRIGRWSWCWAVRAPRWASTPGAWSARATSVARS